MSAQVIPLPTLEILTKARTVIRNSRDYPDDVVQTAIQTLMWRGNWIDYEQAAALNKALQVERANRWLKEQDAIKAAADRVRRAETLREFKRDVLRPAIWLAGAFAVAGFVMATVAKAEATMSIGSPIGVGGYMVRDASTVTLAPTDRPGALAQVTFNNISVNDAGDTGATATLEIPGVAIDVSFEWEVDVAGSDRVTITPPDGVICFPRCTISIVEESTATIWLFSHEAVGF